MHWWQWCVRWQLQRELLGVLRVHDAKLRAKFLLFFFFNKIMLLYFILLNIIISCYFFILLNPCKQSAFDTFHKWRYKICPDHVTKVNCQIPLTAFDFLIGSQQHRVRVGGYLIGGHVTDGRPSYACMGSRNCQCQQQVLIQVEIGSMFQ